MTMEANNDDELTCTLSYWAMGVSAGSSPTGSISVQDREPWLFSDAASQLSLFGTSFARFMDFTLSVENNLEEGRYIEPSAGRDPFEITYGNFDATLDATVAIEDDALFQELINPTAGGFDSIIEFERPNGDTLKITGQAGNIETASHPIPEESTTVEVEVSIMLEDLLIEIEDSNITGAYL